MPTLAPAFTFTATRACVSTHCAGTGAVAWVGGATGSLIALLLVIGGSLFAHGRSRRDIFTLIDANGETVIPSAPVAPAHDAETSVETPEQRAAAEESAAPQTGGAETGDEEGTGEDSGPDGAAREQGG